jgi:hypothetical protein
MLEWAVRWITWTVSRLFITGACISVLQTVLRTQGYYIQFNILAIGAGCLILGVIVWTLGPSKREEKKDTSWSGDIP